MISFELTTTTSAATDVHITTMRRTIENGTTTATIRLESKYLNYAFRDAIQSILDR